MSQSQIEMPTLSAPTLPEVADRPRHTEPDEVAAARIAGVRVERVPGYHDHRGALYPFLDFSRPFWNAPQEPVVHGYLFTIRPGRIKGWGMHRRQADRYVVASGHLRVVLHDGRDGSPDFGRFTEIHFTPETPGLVYIPQGVWHATQNYGKTLGRVFNLPTARFDSRDPDKYRLDPHTGPIAFDWSLRDG